MSTKITYNGKTTEVANGKIATLSCSGKKMATDVVIEIPAATDSPLPVEVLTEAEMIALLTSGEVGGVYKYMGETTDTYENEALYVLENAIGTFTCKYTGDGTASSTFEFEVGMTWAEWIESDYNTSSGTTKIYLATSGKVYRIGGAGGFALYNGSTECLGTDVILENTTYTSAYSTGGGSND